MSLFASLGKDIWSFGGNNYLQKQVKKGNKKCILKYQGEATHFKTTSLRII